jgi:cellulose synthase/poly-beta-1,6-N-acetylglucosamine synthase-like glycosyltransferase
MPKETPKVSVLVPVRDEAENIGECLSSLFRQDYPDYEVLIYEEGSKDWTKDILSALADPRLRVIFGDGPPPGWLGKPWACAKLAEMAKGELLLFLDADVRLSPKAVTSAVAALERENLDLLSLFPSKRCPASA